jgi:hypothetical protein
MMKAWITALLLFLNATLVAGANPMMDDFSGKPDARWEFLTDQVMGGVSTGKMSFVTVDGRPVAHLSGSVSTANRGGFIQFRTALKEHLTESVSGVEITVKGNGERYFVHLRTSWTLLPWQYYQAGFETTGEWQTIKLSWAEFKPSGKMLWQTPSPDSIRSLGIVAFGKDYEADLWIQKVGFY